MLGGLAEDVLLGVEVTDGGVLLLARRPVDRLAVAGSHAEVVDVQAARRRVEQHEVDIVGLAGQRVGGHLLQQRHRVGARGQPGQCTVQLPQQLRRGERRVPGLDFVHRDPDRPCTLPGGQCGGRRVGRVVDADRVVQVAEDLHVDIPRMLLPGGQPFRAGRRVGLLGFAGGPGDVLPPLPQRPRRRRPPVQPLILRGLGPQLRVNLSPCPGRERVHGRLLDPADLKRVPGLLLDHRNAPHGQQPGEDPLALGGKAELLLPQRAAVQRPPLAVTAGLVVGAHRPVEQHDVHVQVGFAAAVVMLREQRGHRAVSVPPFAGMLAVMAGADEQRPPLGQGGQLPGGLDRRLIDRPDSPLVFGGLVGCPAARAFAAAAAQLACSRLGDFVAENVRS